MAAVGDTASGARALLERRITAGLRLSKLDAWREPTADDPFGELTYCWLDYLWNFTNTGEGTCALHEQVVRTQLSPAFEHLMIGEITAKQVEWHLGLQRVESEASAKVAREVLSLLMKFAVEEGVIASNPVAPVKRIEETAGFGARRPLEP